MSARVKAQVRAEAAALSRPPCGAGSMTQAMLMRNVLTAARQRGNR